MAAPKGNKFWERRTKHGRNKIFGSPESLWNECVKYFESVEEHPLIEEKIVQCNGEPVKETLNRMRAMTKEGLYFYLKIVRSTWDDYKSQDDFSAICEHVEYCIRNQKFQGAAAGQLNHAIIARELGLTDKTEITENKGLDITDDQLDARIKSLLSELEE